MYALCNVDTLALQDLPDQALDEERERRDQFLSYSPALEEAYELREELTRIVDPLTVPIPKPRVCAG
jgi:hypothetical protein